MRRSSFSIGLLALASCSSAGSSDGSGRSPFPKLVLPQYSVSVSMSGSKASVSALFLSAPGAIPDAPTGGGGTFAADGAVSSVDAAASLVADLSFTKGESIATNGVPLRQDWDGYSGAVPLIAPGEPYTFTLQVPGKGSYPTAIRMIGDARFSGPASGSSFTTNGAVMITWTQSEQDTSDEVYVAIMPSGDGKGAYATMSVPAGSTTLALSSTELKTLYQTATGSAGGTALGTLTLTRKNQRSLGAPFAGGTATITRVLDQVSISLTN